MLPRVLAAVMGLAARRPLPVALVVGLLAVGGGALALRLQPTSATDTLVSRSSDSYKASQRYHQKFGDDAVYVLVRQRLTFTTLTADIERVVGLEGCIAGNVPRDRKVTFRGGPNGPCAQFAKTKPAKVVFGPGTFINESVGQIQDEFNRQRAASSAQAQRAATAARKLAKAKGYSKAQQNKFAKQAESLVYNEFVRNLLQLGLRYGITSVPQLNDPNFVSKLVFDDTKPAGTPKARFAYIFPTKNSALIQVRLKPNLTEKQRNKAIALIRAAVAMPDWKLPNGHGTYVVTGAPVVVSDLTSSITDSIELLLVAALLVMGLTLAVVFRTSRRLLPLGVALTAAGLTFGLLSLIGASLTMASIGVLPVLIGLAVDYAIQLQSRVQEEAADGDVPGAVARVAARGAPTVATAAAATAAGFLVLVLSPVPMVRGFGLLLVLGIFLALLCALTLGTAALVGRPRAGARKLPGALRGAGEALAAAGRGAGELVFDNPASRRLRNSLGTAARGSLRVATTRPRRVLGVALAIAVLGWVLDTQVNVESDVQKLVPQNLSALRDLRALEDSTGVGGEIDVVVTTDRLTDPAVVGWMAKYQAKLVKRFGFSDKRGCGKAELCPAFSLPDLFRSGVGKQTKASIDALLDAVPSYFSQGVITPDRRTATLAFGIRLMPLERQKEVVDVMRAALDPPPGVHAELAGLPVLAAEANAEVASPWRRALLLVAGLLAVGLVLLVALRSRRRALVPLVPIVLATGWSALLLFATRIPLNPMSVTLGALVIAISTEFSVLLSERYRSERIAGHAVTAALERAYRSTGAAVVASGTTAIAGFAVLVLSDIRMLRDFGAVTVVDLTVSLLGVLVVLPAVLVLAEQGDLRVGLPRLRVPRPHLPRTRLPRRGRRGAAAAPDADAPEPQDVAAPVA